MKGDFNHNMDVLSSKKSALIKPVIFERTDVKALMHKVCSSPRTCHFAHALLLQLILSLYFLAYHRNGVTIGRAIWMR